MRRLKVPSLACLLACTLMACGSDSKTATSAANGDTATATTPSVAAPDGHQAAQASHESADGAGGSDDVTAQQGGATGHVAMRNLAMSGDAMLDAETLMQYAEPQAHATHRALSVETQIATSVNVMGCKAVFDGNLTASSSGYNLDANIIYDANSCKHSRKVTGSASLDANFTSSARTVALTQAMTQTLANGDTIAISSENPNAPTYTLTSTGYASAGNVIATASVNEHRVRKTADGNVVFDFSISTNPNALLSITSGFVVDANASANAGVAQTRTIVSGVNTVVHNVAGYTAKHTFDNLSRIIDTCMCPSAGSLTEDITYTGASSATYTRIYTFTGCGTAQVHVTASTDPNVVVGTSSVTWDACN